jgi:hypothetical protein
MLKIWRSGAALASGLCVVATLSVAVRAGEDTVKVDSIHSRTGIWKAPVYKVAASSDLDRQVWGKSASKVRTVQLAVEPNGEGLLRVENSVVDGHGRVKAFSASLVEAHLQIAPPAAPNAARLEPVVTVMSADERYLDGSKERRPIEGLKVSLSVPASDPSLLNLRYDTVQGTGSFGETLTRQSSKGPTTKSAGHTHAAPGKTAATGAPLTPTHRS